MKIPIKFKTTTPSLFIALGLALACFGLVPNARATDLESALPNGNTADGVRALNSVLGGAWNSAFGYQALTSETSGSLNTAVGINALQNNNGAIANTAIGMLALGSNVTGEQNVAVGAQALVFNEPGVSNTAAGTQALFANTSGSGNCAVGQWALAFNTVGDVSNAVGYGALFNNGTPGAPVHGNNAFGFVALASNVTGPNNSAFGDAALVSNVIAADNCAFGDSALFSNDATGPGGTANGNNAFGSSALFSNDGGDSNDAFGTFALFSNVSGVWNNAFGFGALGTNVTGNFNTAIGDSAGFAIAGNGNVDIGEGVFGAAADNDLTRIRNIGNTPQASGLFVTIDAVVPSGGNVILGYQVSSRRYKEDIKPMDKASETLFALQPVTFRYKGNMDPARVLQYGLIAEDVAKVNPELVINDPEGKPASLRFLNIQAMMLNEFLKEHSTVEQLKSTVAKQEAIIAQQQKGMEVLTAQLKDQAAQIQKVSARLEASRPAPQVVLSTP